MVIGIEDLADIADVLIRDCDLSADTARRIGARTRKLLIFLPCPDFLGVHLLVKKAAKQRILLLIILPLPEVTSILLVIWWRTGIAMVGGVLIFLIFDSFQIIPKAQVAANINPIRVDDWRRVQHSSTAIVVMHFPTVRFMGSIIWVVKDAGIKVLIHH